MYEVKIIPVGDIDSSIMDYLAVMMPGNVSGSFDVLSSAKISLVDAYDSARRQYNSTKILSKFLEMEVSDDSKILAVTNVDLFVPIFTFVFGLAQLGGKAALFSTHRLHQEFYGLPKDKSLFFTRCEKEAAHELGHTYGLKHCDSYECVMHFSNSIEQVDIKPATFCPSCLNLSQANNNI